MHGGVGGGSREASPFPDLSGTAVPVSVDARIKSGHERTPKLNHLNESEHCNVVTPMRGSRRRFEPLNLGGITLANRIAVSPMSKRRSNRRAASVRVASASIPMRTRGRWRGLSVFAGAWVRRRSAFSSPMPDARVRPGCRGRAAGRSPRTPAPRLRRRHRRSAQSPSRRIGGTLTQIPSWWPWPAPKQRRRQRPPGPGRTLEFGVPATVQ
jgi:hypothetical protein